MIRLALMASLIAFAMPATAHDWYPHECCHDRDCYPVSQEEIEMLPDGAYRVKATGEEFLEPNDPRSGRHARFSPDGRFHRCSLFGDRKNSTLCLFVPSQGS